MINRAQFPPKKPQKSYISDVARDFDVGLAGRLAVVLGAFDSRQQAADVAGVGTDQLSRYLRNASQPAFETVARLAVAKGFSLDWVWSGTGPRKTGETADRADPEMVAIPVMDARAGAGGEQYAVDETPISSLWLPRQFLVSHGVRPASVKLVFCSGDSMEPTIRDGAPMIVDTSDMGEADDVYVMRRGNGIVVKRLQHLTGGAVILKSDNSAYEPERLPRDEADELSIIGRVGLVLQSI